MRHVVLFSRTTKISFSGLGESPERFSTSCSAARRAAASADTEELSGGPPPFAPPAARGTRLPRRDGAGADAGAAGGAEAGPRLSSAGRIATRLRVATEGRGGYRDPRYSRKRKSSPGRRPAAILPVRPDVSAAAAAPSGSAPEERKKKKQKREKQFVKSSWLQPLLSEEPRRLLKRSAAECRGGGNGKERVGVRGGGGREEGRCRR